MTANAANYAKILFDMKISESAIQDAKEIISESKELASALSNPSVKIIEKHKVIDTIFGKEIQNFLKVLCDNNSSELLNQIFEMYDEMVLETKNIIKATFTYVTKPEEEQLNKIKEFLKSKYNKAGVLLELKEDTSLIGGFVLSVGNVEYDKSIKGTLSELSKTLVWR